MIHLLVYFFIFTICGCATMETQRVRSENLSLKKDYEIINVILKNGQVIDLRNKSALYFKEYNDKKNVILYTTSDTTRNSEDSLKVYNVTNIIELDSVKKVTIEKWETNVSIPVTAGFVFLGLILLGLAMTFSMNLGGR